MAEEQTLAEATIYSTRNYDKFSYADGNRKTTIAHIRELITSFTDHPSLAITKPLLVNDKFQIIDGQHSFEASKALALPVYYIIGHNLDISHARLLNATQKGWKLIDFLRSYVQSGEPNYVKVAELQEDYSLPLSSLMPYAAGYQAGSLSRNFRSGSFKVMKDKDLMYHRLDALKSLAPYVPFWATDKFARAFFTIITTAEIFDPERLVAKLAMGVKMEYKKTVLEFMHEIERVYNHGQKANTVRLFT